MFSTKNSLPPLKNCVHKEKTSELWIWVTSVHQWNNLFQIIYPRHELFLVCTILQKGSVNFTVYKYIHATKVLMLQKTDFIMIHIRPT
jgi:hypothetical protein